jgi:hypothetical protein
VPTPWTNGGFTYSGSVPFGGQFRAEAHLNVVAQPGTTATADWGVTNGSSTTIIQPVGFIPTTIVCATSQCGDLHPIFSSPLVVVGYSTLSLEVVVGGTATITGYWSVSSLYP